MKYNDASENLTEWSTEKLEKYAQSLHATIYGPAACYGVNDMIRLEMALRVLEQRGIAPVSSLTFIKEE